MIRTFNDFLDNLLPGTKVRYFRDLYHFVGSIKDGDVEVFIFKSWHKRWQTYVYHNFTNSALEIFFDGGSLYIGSHKRKRKK